jgi:hypothetical protein
MVSDGNESRLKLNLRRIDHTNHTSLTMVSLGAVVPNRISIVDGNSKGRVRLSARDFNKARVEAIIDGRTRARVATASNTVGTRVVVESDSIADSGSGRVGRED